MDIAYKTKSQRIKDSEDNLEQVRRIIAVGGYKDKETEQDVLDLAEKDLAFIKGRIAFKEYWAAHKKVYGRSL